MYTRKLNEEKDFQGKAGKCAKEILEWLLKNHLWQDTIIYVNGLRLVDQDPDGHYDYRNMKSENPVEDFSVVYVEDNINVHQYLEYAGDFLSMAFEGPLYEILNDYYSAEYCEKLQDEFDAILNKYGMYYELGNAWNLTLCKI